MKKLFLIFNLFFGIIFLFSQNTDSISLRKTKFISFSPKKNLSDNVNGINVGVLDAYDGQKINGFNLQFNPIVIIYPLLPKAIPPPEKDNGSVVINGLQPSRRPSTAGFRRMPTSSTPTPPPSSSRRPSRCGRRTASTA